MPGKAFQSLRGSGFKSNYFDVETGEPYWISGPHKAGQDSLYATHVVPVFDEDDCRIGGYSPVARADLRRLSFVRSFMRLLGSAFCLFVGSLAPIGVHAQATGRWYQVPEGSWRVPASLVAEMRAGINAAAQEAVPRSTTKESRSVLKDTVQFNGFIDPKSKRKVVQLFGMCETDRSFNALSAGFLYISDGGNCYYWAQYDPAQRKFVSFDFNGAA